MKTEDKKIYTVDPLICGPPDFETKPDLWTHIQVPIQTKNNQEIFCKRTFTKTSEL